MAHAYIKTAKEDSSAKKAGAAVTGSMIGGLPGAYSGYKGAKDKEEGKNNIGKHSAGHAAGMATIGGAVGAGVAKAENDMAKASKKFGKVSLKNVKKAGAKAALGGAVIGGLSGAASYGVGRLWSKDKEDKTSKTRKLTKKD